MSFEYFEEIYVSRYSADIHTYDARQLEPYHVLPFSPRPPVPPRITISGVDDTTTATAVPKVFLFVAGFVTTTRAADGRTRRRSRRWRRTMASEPATATAAMERG